MSQINNFSNVDTVFDTVSQLITVKFGKNAIYYDFQLFTVKFGKKRLLYSTIQHITLN